VLGWALTRRIDAAWLLTAILLALGIVASLTKGLDWEEAVALGVVLTVLLPSRRVFYRKAALTGEPFSPEWVVAIAVRPGREPLDRLLLVPPRRVLEPALVALHAAW
jgi:phosphatidylglycerol lysyltransferase